ncbi:MAG: hypothetical protein CFE21_05960 [Bacteroidetes bacterium B1(2017)]|nr:MAG: hypothetical protein CFE21_05960 [Bacteroidetes bacterium B1(2017)]
MEPQKNAFRPEITEKHVEPRPSDKVIGKIQKKHLQQMGMELFNTLARIVRFGILLIKVVYLLIKRIPIINNRNT